MVECHLAKVKVAGPNPVSRSTKMRSNPLFGQSQSASEQCRDEDTQGSRERSEPPRTRSKYSTRTREESAVGKVGTTCGYPVSRSTKMRSNLLFGQSQSASEQCWDEDTQGSRERNLRRVKSQFKPKSHNMGLRKVVRRQRQYFGTIAKW